MRSMKKLNYPAPQEHHSTNKQKCRKRNCRPRACSHYRHRGMLQRNADKCPEKNGYQERIAPCFGEDSSQGNGNAEHYRRPYFRTYTEAAPLRVVEECRCISNRCHANPAQIDTKRKANTPKIADGIAYCANAEANIDHYERSKQHQHHDHREWIKTVMPQKNPRAIHCTTEHKPREYCLKFCVSVVPRQKRIHSKGNQCRIDYAPNRKHIA